VGHGHEGAAPLAERLRARGLRLTAQRQRVLAAVAGLEHATPEAIGARLREEAGPGGAAPDTSTVYRNLELLERLGLVWHTHLGKGAPV
jgi:Fur family transcriptional regulator, ferric uptake regulator